MKTELPTIDDELSPRKRVNLKAIRPAGIDDATVDENSRRMGNEWGAATIIAQGARTPLASLRIEVPEYLDRELARAAAEQRVTKQYLVVAALKQAGYHVEPEDLVADKRKVRRRRT